MAKQRCLLYVSQNLLSVGCSGAVVKWLSEGPGGCGSPVQDSTAPCQLGCQFPYIVFVGVPDTDLHVLLREQDIIM